MVRVVDQGVVLQSPVLKQDVEAIELVEDLAELDAIDLLAKELIDHPELRAMERSDEAQVEAGVPNKRRFLRLLGWEGLPECWGIEILIQAF